MKKNSLNSLIKGSLEPSINIDVRSTIIDKIRAGDISIAPRKQLLWIRRLLIGGQITISALTVIAGAALVNGLISSGSFAFANEALFGLSEFRGSAWSATLESTPWLLISLFIAATLVLGISLWTGRQFRKNNLLINN